MRNKDSVKIYIDEQQREFLNREEQRDFLLFLVEELGPDYDNLYKKYQESLEVHPGDKVKCLNTDGTVRTTGICLWEIPKENQTDGDGWVIELEASEFGPMSIREQNLSLHIQDNWDKAFVKRIYEPHPYEFTEPMQYLNTDGKWYDIHNHNIYSILDPGRILYDGQIYSVRRKLEENWKPILKMPETDEELNEVMIEHIDEFLQFIKDNGIWNLEDNEWNPERATVDKIRSNPRDYIESKRPGWLTIIDDAEGTDAVLFSLFNDRKPCKEYNFKGIQLFVTSFSEWDD